MARKLPRIITQEDFEKMFAEAKRLEDQASLQRKSRIKQYRVAMLLGFESGMRISEVIGLKNIIPGVTPEMIDNSKIMVKAGKGGKDRIVPRPKRLNESAVKMLPLKIKRRALQNFITELGRRVLGKEITFHTLRHGFVTHLIDQGRPIHEVQMLAGHSRLDTTGIYLHANPIKAVEGAREVF